MRHADLAALQALDAESRRLVRASPCEPRVVDLYRQDPVRFDPDLVRAAQTAIGDGGEPLISGPLHDSAALAEAGIPTVMLFAPSIGGLSHARSEDMREDDLAAAIAVLGELVAALTDGGPR